MTTPQQPPKKIIAIAAVSKNGVIGKGSELPWHIPEDMQFFRDSTRGQIVIMGRKTFDALGKPLPKRENAVITRDPSWKREGVKTFLSLEDAIRYYQGDVSWETIHPSSIFIIGGAEIYRLSLPILDEVWLTEIDAAVEGDIYFPDYNEGVFRRPEFQRSIIQKQLDFTQSAFHYTFFRYFRA